MDKKQIGRIGLSMAINYFTVQGYTISIPLNDTQWYDLIIEKDGVFQTVQCKATTTEKNTIDLRNTGGTKGKEYGNVLDYKTLDLLFCVGKDLQIWVIPIKDLQEWKTSKSITLLAEPSKNGQGFPSYKYMKQL